MKPLILIILCVIAVTLAEPRVAVTVYNDNLALVREVRDLQFEKGVQTFDFVDVAAQIDPTSVHFKSLTDPDGLELLEQNFEYDLVGLHRLLEKYIDEKVLVSTEKGDVYNGTLLSSQNGDVILQSDGGGIRAVKSGTIQTVEFPKLPEGLMTRPTLVWLLRCSHAGTHESEISYLTHHINWHAEYVAVVNEDDTALDLAGWVSIDNKSGATYEDAKVKLVAGDVHKEEKVSLRRRKDMMMAMAEAPQQFEEKEFFEYHLYTLQRPATIKDRQIKQLSLFPSQTASTEKLYFYDGQRQQNKVRVDLQFKNSQENGLGMPLPKGKIRVYKEDEDGSQEFIGEDGIDHIPKDEKVRVTLGNAFDVVGERVVRSTERISSDTRKQTVEISLRNHKDEAIEVIVVEHFGGDWEFIGDTPEIKEKTAYKVEFVVEVPANGENVFDYTVLYHN